MADRVLKSRPPAEVLAPFADADVAVSALAPRARLILRGDAEIAARAGAALGLTVPTRPPVVAESGSRAVLWLGPDEWLILAQGETPAEIAALLAPALKGVAHSLVDVSHRQTAFGVTGRLAARLLSSGCPLDLHVSVFKQGMAARTVFHKCEIVLWRRGEDDFQVEVWRSFAPYVREQLIEARRAAYGL